jgi:hypothetical protein
VQQFTYDSSDYTLIITEIAYYSQANENDRIFMKVTLNGDNVAGSAKVADGNSPFNSGSELIAAYEIAPDAHPSMTYNFIKGASFDSEVSVNYPLTKLSSNAGSGGYSCSASSVNEASTTAQPYEPFMACV